MLSEIHVCLFGWFFFFIVEREANGISGLKMFSLRQTCLKIFVQVTIF